MSVFENMFKDNNLSNLTDEEKAIVLYNNYKKLNSSILYVTNSLYEANKMHQILLNYTNDVLLFPMDDFLTSEALAVSPELKINRIETIHELIKSKSIVITNLMGYLRFLPSINLYKDKIIKLKANSSIDMHDLISKLMSLGYTKETIVNKTGDIAVRGYVVDIFPLLEENPIRIEFWGDEIDSIRYFDVNNQLTLQKVDSIEIFPITEFLTNKDIDTFSLKQRDLIKYEKISSIADYADNIVFFNDKEQLINSYTRLEEEIFNYRVSSDLDKDTKFMYSFNEIKINKEYNFSTFNTREEVINAVKGKEIDYFPQDKDGINKKLNEYLKKYSTVLLCISNLKRANKLLDELENKNIILTNENEILEGKINLIVKRMTKGFIYNNIVVICENDIYGSTNDNNYKTKFKVGTKIKDLTKLTIGDYVVHANHGIGIYKGLKTLEKNGLKKDYLLIEYKDSDKLYIPVEKIDVISKFSSKEGYMPKINKLGSTEWQKTKYKVRKKIQDMANELLKLYALRESVTGYAFPSDDNMQIEFEKEFEHTETLDQIKVTNEIKEDMEKPHPMDRLLCGDVGYGKTEVAFRAIFKAILGGKQVAFLCPTTILSTQHYNNAVNRFRSFGVKIELLNRFVTPKKVKQVIENLKEGKVDLLIGTHRILSDDIEYKDLGLLVIDEEQRFGVKHKEKIKEYKNNIDVLTLSATPIPRTLQMSMTGLRNLSLIETPPVDRYPIQTYVVQENDSIIKDAIYKEISRQGQVFILLNNIEMLEGKKRELNLLVPEARIEIAHGQMNKSELEDIMIRFNSNEFDILLCTTIIETGIDIPNVNTLIIYDSENFGLSQLYQIRGRVGRSNKIAYCYLMYNKKKVLSEIAIKRLKAIQEFTELGSGFAIAMRDLSIRGAGDILGSEQAGFIDTIGMELFTNLLDKEINKLKGIEVEEDEEESMPLVDVETSIDDNYVSDEDIKIEIHKKINEIDSYESIERTKEELTDRFGKLDDSIIIYMHEEYFEKLASELNLKNIRQFKNYIEITIIEKDLQNINVQDLFYDVTKLSKMFRFSMRGKNLVITLDTVKLDKHFIYYLIDLFNIIKKNKKD